MFYVLISLCYINVVQFICCSFCIGIAWFKAIPHFVEYKTLILGEIMWLRFFADHRREGVQEVDRGDPGLPGPGGVEEQGLQQVPRHVEHRGHHLRLTLGNIPLQWGRGHPWTDPKRILHVSPSSMEGDIQSSYRCDKQLTPGTKAKNMDLGCSHHDIRMKT